jgi:prepilin peptidase CpaA
MRPSFAFLAVALALATLAAWLDARRGRVPNWLTLPALALAPLAHALLARGHHTVIGLPAPLFAASWSLSAALVAGAIPYLMFKLGLAGAGDAKLLAALGALLLPEVGLAAEFSAFAAAAFFVPARLAYRGTLFGTLVESWTFLALGLRRKSRTVGVPHALTEQLRLGPFILLGTLLAPFLARVPA